MSNQPFILEYINTELQETLSKIDWLGLNVKINAESSKSDAVMLFIRIYDIDFNMYQNINDKIRVGAKLIPRSLPVDSHIVIFCNSKSHSNQLKVIGLLLQALRDNRKMDIGGYNWLNNDNSPLTIDSIDSPKIDFKMRIKEQYGFKDSIPLFFRVSSCIDSKIAEDYTEVKERKVQMVKMDD